MLRVQACNNGHPRMQGFRISPWCTSPHGQVSLLIFPLVVFLSLSKIHNGFWISWIATEDKPLGFKVGAGASILLAAGSLPRALARAKVRSQVS